MTETRTEEKQIVHIPEAMAAPIQRATAAFDIARYESMKNIAAEMSKSELIPKSLHGKPADVLLAMTRLESLGLNPVADLSGTFVIGNAVRLWGETWLAVIQAAPGYAGMAETWDAQTKTATTTFRRVIMGQVQSLTKSFSMEDAVKAKLAGKDTYGSYPQDMITWRARTRAGALFSDVLHGMGPMETAGDVTVELDAQPEPTWAPQRLSEAKAPAAPADPKATPPANESFVLAGVDVDHQGKAKDGTDVVVWRIDTVDGGSFYTKSKDLAEGAQELEGRAVKIESVLRKNDKREATKITVIEEP